MADKLILKHAAGIISGESPLSTALPDGIWEAATSEGWYPEGGVDYTYLTVLVLTPRMLALAEKLEPGWFAEKTDPYTDCLRLRPAGELAGPMAWPLLDAEGLAQYLERYTAIQLGNALDHSAHATWLTTARPVPLPEPKEDHVRVLRVIEYTGPRALVERQVSRSLHGTREGERYGGLGHGADNARCMITAATLNEFPEVLDLERDTRWRCPACDTLGCEPQIGYRASGEAFQGCEFCTQEDDKDRSRRAAANGLDTPPSAVPQSPAPTPEQQTEQQPDQKTAESIAAAEAINAQPVRPQSATPTAAVDPGKLTDDDIPF